MAIVQQAAPQAPAVVGGGSQKYVSVFDQATQRVERVPADQADAYDSWTRSIANQYANRPTAVSTSKGMVPITGGPAMADTSFAAFQASQGARNKSNGNNFDFNTIIQQLTGAGDGGFQKAQTDISSLLADYTKKSAFDDARALIEQNALQQQQKQMPAIQRAVEGSGTSAGSMQALLSQNLARDITMQSGALGAEQAKAYGGISSSLSGSLAQLAASGDPMAKILAQILQTQMQNSSSEKVANIGASASMNNAAVGANSNKYSTDVQSRTSRANSSDALTAQLQQIQAQQEIARDKQNNTLLTGGSRYA